MDERIEKTFSVSSPARLDLSNIRGSVELRPGDDGTISVIAIKHTDTGDAGNTIIELTQAADGAVRAATRFPDGWWLWLTGSKPCKVDYIVTAPRACSLKVKGVSNRVFAEGFEGQLDFNSVSGDLTVRELKGCVRLNSVSGDVTASALDGELDLETVSGDVVLTNSALTAVQAKTVSGRLRLQTSSLVGSYRFNSVSGNVVFTLPAESRFEADLRSISGKLSSAFPVASQSSGPGSATLTVRSGGARVSLNSVSGNLRLESAGGIPPMAQPVSSKSADRRAILERIERGEISAAEGLAQLGG